MLLTSSRSETTTDKRLGLVTEKDIWVDYSLLDLIQLYEKKCGPVLLSDYDFETELDDPKYNRKKASGKTSMSTFASDFRDELIMRRVLESKHNKIVLVYGNGHAMKLRLYFQHLKGFTLDKKYNAKKVKNAK